MFVIAISHFCADLQIFFDVLGARTLSVCSVTGNTTEVDGHQESFDGTGDWKGCHGHRVGDSTAQNEKSHVY